MSKDNSGPAFPIPGGEYYLQDKKIGFSQTPGMSLRDWFATHAPPQPSWWNPKGWDGGSWGLGDQSQRTQHLAEWNYFYADCMLAEREK